VTKRALIVDDSRLARTVLSRLLEENGVASDAAESAESALEYLKHSRPDVVFLDHNMPGIDGFQALDAIKKNPVTATIPVMMYTSEQGEVYVGQARALGALGVLPKTVQPVEVSKVLRTLHLIPGEPTARGPTRDREPPAPPSSREAEIAARPAAAAVPLDAESLRALLDEVLSAKTAGLREDFRREIQRLAVPAPAAEPPPPASAAQRLARRDRVLALATGLIVTTCAAFGYLYWTASASFEEATASFSRRLFAETSKREDPRNSAPQSVAARAAGPSDVLGVLEWGVNQGGRYGFGTVPLDDERATVFAGLFDQLARLGFTGTVAIEVHTGRFCMDYGQNGGLELAPANELAAMCDQIGWSDDQAVSVGRSQSLAFANEVASAAARYPRMKIESASRGTAEPAVAYPGSSADLTAGAWNAVAAANQRVVVAILPEPSASATGERR
jgi:CheY-like chemotaxis protein